MKIKTKDQGVITADEFNKIYKKKTKTRHEEKMQVNVCKFIKDNYPDVIFTCDLASGMNLGKHIGGMNKRMRSSRALPDLSIDHKREYISDKLDMMGNDIIIKTFNGLRLELKKYGTRRKDGTIPPAWRKELVNGMWMKYDHHAEQEAILARLRKQGFMAEFACGYDEAIKIIIEYLGPPVKTC